MDDYDERYQYGKIYKLYNENDHSQVYIGSTIKMLNERLSVHKSKSKTEKSLIYRTINNNWNDWEFEIIEHFPCRNEEELKKREGEVIREYGTLNVRIEGQTRQEYYENNKDKIKKYYENNKDKFKEKSKEYYENNKDKIKKYYENNKDKFKEKSKEYYENNKNKIKEYRDQNKDKFKEYRDQNKDKFKEYYENNNKEKFTCICGGKFTYSSKSIHQKTKKHLNYISNLLLKRATSAVL